MSGSSGTVVEVVVVVSSTNVVVVSGATVVSTGSAVVVVVVVSTGSTVVVVVVSCEPATPVHVHSETAVSTLATIPIRRTRPSQASRRHRCGVAQGSAVRVLGDLRVNKGTPIGRSCPHSAVYRGPRRGKRGTTT